MRCGVKNCKTKGGQGISVYRFPSKFDNHKRICQTSCERLKQWIQAVNRDDLTESFMRNHGVCGKHFISGKRAELYDTTNPDWVPSLNLGYEKGPLEDHKYFIGIGTYCRLCLKQHENYVELFDNNGVEMMKALTSLMIRIDDSAPNVACQNCFLILKRTYTIQQRLIEVETYLQKNFTSECASVIKTEVEELNELKEDISEPNNEDISQLNKGIKNEPVCSYSDSTSLLKKALLDQKMRSLDEKLRECATTIEDNLWSTNSFNKSKFPIRPPEPNEDIKQEPVCSDPDATALSKDALLNQRMKLLDEKLRECTNTLEENYWSTCSFEKPSETMLCRICPQEVRVEDYRKHRKTHSDGYCHYCGVTSKHINSLRSHVLHEHRQPEQSCKECGMMFNNKRRYDLHVRRSHTGEAKYVCHVCGAKFFSSSANSRHLIEKHSDAPKYTCDVCGKSFAKKDRMDTHKVIHSNNAVFVCEFCGKGFKFECNMKIHMMKYHGWSDVETDKCDICGRGFASKLGLDIHLAKHRKDTTK